VTIAMTRHDTDMNDGSHTVGGGHFPPGEISVTTAADVIEVGPARAEHPAQSRTAPILRRAALPVAVTTLVVAAIFGAGHHHTPSRIAPASTPEQPAKPPPSAAVRARLVVPQYARPGERLTVLAYRNRRLCGPAQLRFDSAAIPQRVITDIGPVNADWTELFMSIDLPRSATPGPHRIQLYGPKPGGRGPTCTDLPEHQGEVARTIITIK
jgi:hypothetical protein